MYKLIPLFSAIIVILSAVTLLFWNFTLKDYLPTALPKNFEARQLNEKIDFNAPVAEGKAVFLHFFNPECPCSKFNTDHVRELIKKYGTKAEFRIVLQVDNPDYDWQEVEEKYELNAPYLIDFDGEIAKACGVYSTPQAVILTADRQLFFKGNYNRAKYCTSPDSNYAQIAMDRLFNKLSPPPVTLSAGQAYGCQLPQEEFDYDRE